MNLTTTEQTDLQAQLAEAHRKLAILQRTCAALNALMDRYDEVTPEPWRSTFARERQRIMRAVAA